MMAMVEPVIALAIACRTLPFTYEQYLDYNRDFHVRRNITKLRISAHKLEIEADRYRTKNKKKILI